MSRNTHDIDLDHHGTFSTNAVFTDQGADPASPSAGTHVAYSKSGGLYVKDSSGSVVGPLGAPSPIGSTEFLTGNDSQFTTTVGNWTATGGTLTRDTTATYVFPNIPASLKFVTTAQNQYISVPVSGTFKAGVEYQCLIYIQTESGTQSATSCKVDFGLVGTDAVSVVNVSSYATHFFDGIYWPFMGRWVPSADRTGVTVRLTRNGTETGTETYHVGLVRVVDTYNDDAKLGMTHSPDKTNGEIYIAASSSEVVLAASPSSARGYFSMSPNSVSLHGPSGELVQVNAGSAYIVAGPSAGDLVGNGVEIDVGPHFVGLYISEKDSGTVQIYPDYSVGYNVELKDRGTGKHWEMVNTNGDVSIPSMGRLRQLSAAPASPTEGDSYYDTTTHKSYTYDGTIWQAWW